MANGKLGSAALAADTNTVIYTVPAGLNTTFNIVAVNRGTLDARVRIAITTEALNPTDADFIEFDALVPADGGVLERVALIAGSGERVIARSSTAFLTVRVHGLEEFN